jgi:hypothetical protein
MEALVSPDVLDRVLGWLAAHQGHAGRRPAGDHHRRQDRPRRKDKTGKAPHLVAALAHGIGAVLGQVAVDAKSNQIPAVRNPPESDHQSRRRDHHDRRYTYPQRHRAGHPRPGADYVMTVKGNMPTLYRPPAQPPWPAGSRSHGEIENNPTGSATSPARKTNSWSEPGTRHASWRRCAAWPSACRAGRPHQHRRRQPAPRPRPAAHTEAAVSGEPRLNDFAGSRVQVVTL